MTRRFSRWAVVAAIALAGCRTTLRGTAIDPLKTQTPEAAIAELRERVESFRGAKSLMRVRATSGGRTQSFRAQLAVLSKDDMDLIVYTPVGTTAATIKARGESITSDAPADVAQAVTSWISFSGTKPAEMAMLVLGLPAAPGAAYEASPAGLARASVFDAVVTFEPPQFPPKRVVIRRGGDVVEIEHQEIVATP